MINMVVIIKIGRILPKNWVQQQFRKTTGFFTFQSNMFEMWRSALSSFKKEADKDLKLMKDTLVVTIRKDNEIFEGKNLQWLICECSSYDVDREKKCFETFEKDVQNPIQKNYDRMKRDNQLNIDKPNNLTKTILEKSVVAKHNVENMILKGLNKSGESSVNNTMLELDIIIDKEFIIDPTI